MAPASGMDLMQSREAERVGSPGPRVAGVRTAGFGPEPYQQCLKFTGFAHGKMIEIIVLCESHNISLIGRQSDPWAAWPSSTGYKLLK